MKKIAMIVMMVVMMLAGAGAVMVEGVSADDKTICSDNNATADMKELAGCNEDKRADEVANTGLQIVISAAGIIAVGVMVYGGFVYLTSQGDPSKAKRGRDVILYGLVGLAVVVLAFAIVTFVASNLPNPS